ncbi:hypothetical protein PR003_g16836 [Phytophthora rubi]|uniref:Uncharacterized protein n=1 Tax=Phytophthora rubi TaxID=129364 RepID=A0A6A3HHZ8_9STRA|nr:hypothetical protein PR002_g27807 [Phytophthora rubi]KAE8968592.1 hypothetical protein PR001_g27742 [Phytophthora rubi]KAE9323976.1 hypothetical protein PR003_g16836 [Phytophthora rubi]
MPTKARKLATTKGWRSSGELVETGMENRPVPRLEETEGPRTTAGEDPGHSPEAQGAQTEGSEPPGDVSPRREEVAAGASSHGRDAAADAPACGSGGGWVASVMTSRAP